ncbi:unnamed protein product [Heligmosomoides polygyrus]|uniref:Uncharacterized protein n=1 Tax=Heligmosomoides polygyrus TaxID=6339 RepID=A0A183FSA3_HELPZ|nr:unnamed protein product [Heligmosomoides polygyrus]
MGTTAVFARRSPQMTSGCDKHNVGEGRGSFFSRKPSGGPLQPVQKLQHVTQLEQLKKRWRNHIESPDEALNDVIMSYALYGSDTLAPHGSRVLKF